MVVLNMGTEKNKQSLRKYFSSYRESIKAKGKDEAYSDCDSLS